MLDYERGMAAKRQEASQAKPGEKIGGTKTSETVDVKVAMNSKQPSGRAPAVAAKKVGSSEDSVRKADKVVKKGSSSPSLFR